MRKKIAQLLELAAQPDPKAVDVSPERLNEAISIALSDPELYKDYRIQTALKILYYETQKD